MIRDQTTNPVLPQNNNTQTISIDWVNQDTKAVKKINIKLLLGTDDASEDQPAWVIGTAKNHLDYNITDNPYKLILPYNEIVKLAGGEWRAELIIPGRKYDFKNNDYGTAHEFHIYMTLSFQANSRIFFPASPNSNPQVNLNLNTRPGAKSNTTISGHNTLDMCLYSGFDVNTIQMTFSDEGASSTGRPTGEFSVYNDGADKTQSSNRIDYKLSVINPITNAAQDIENGTPITWTNIINQNVHQRQVVIPGVNGISLCIPAPLTFTTPAFTMADKNSGHYTGKVSVTFSPST